MRALIGTRKSTIVLGLAIVLALTGSPNYGRGTTRLPQNASICFVVDGQIYCIPGTGNNGPSMEAWLRLR